MNFSQLDNNELLYPIHTMIIQTINASAWRKQWDADKRVIFFCVCSTLFWCILAHGVAFFNESFSHDSLTSILAEGGSNVWTIQIGRCFFPTYLALTRGYLNLPLLIGFYSLIWISISVILSIKIFATENRVFCFLLSGIYTSNLTVTATCGTYINCLDVYLFALCLSIFSVYAWKKWRLGWLIGSIALALSLGMYQAYISVAITLVVICLIIAILEHIEFRKVFLKGLLGIAMILCGGIAYYLMYKIVLLVTGISPYIDGYNSMKCHADSFMQICNFCVKGYLDTLVNVIQQPLTFRRKFVYAINCTALVIFGFTFLKIVYSKNYGIWERILFGFLVLCLPMAMSAIYPLTGWAHHLMIFPIFLIYPFFMLVILRKDIWRKSHLYVFIYFRFLLVFLISVILLGNVRLSNTLYLKKNLEQKANLSFYTRVVERMETHPGYIPGTTPVVFIGENVYLLPSIRGFERARHILGANRTNIAGLNYNSPMQKYFRYVLMNPAIMADNETWIKMRNETEVYAMQIFPDEGSVKILDGIMVVKLGAVETE